MKKVSILVSVWMTSIVLTGCATSNGNNNDPIEGFNRVMFDFNYKFVDHYVLEPVAKVWRDYLPTPITKGLSNVANNLDEPVSFINRLLEGNPKKAFVHFNRFWINTVFGIGGLFDIASASKELQVYEQRSFGETLGSYGVDAGAYIVLPIYNATTPRQLTGVAVDAAYTYPFWHWIGGPWSLVKYGVQTVDNRAKTLEQTELLNQAQDPYVAFREIYYQNLKFKVDDGRASESEDNSETLPENILKEID